MGTKHVIMGIARIGYAAKCVVYCILGMLTLYVAFTAANTEQVSKKSVFQEILNSPFGSISLTAIIAGFSCYVVWRFVQGITNPDDLDMSKVKDVLIRLFYFFSAIAYTSATYVAFKVLMGSPDDQQDKKQQVGDSIMQETWGVLLVGSISIAVVVFAFTQFKHAIKGDFMDKLVNDMSHTQQKIANLCGRIGFTGRGIVYLLVGGFFMNASLTQNSEKAGGLSKALSTLLVQPFGPWMVGAVSVGLIGFGIFCGFEGRYRKTN
ncbi:DUF1206 domain-containing protein [Aliiglaciecola sp. LCG003]|uniref:DUF1206 domain-containing protein n=1 Tax=Aliiglaciecola sp. LCG003 TaxID=3053655 RepID=UPI00257289A4|nr:DUF1206 domain-containing protein [Aliiglaciecola sp. LCG003]WJG09183.1 DUF1206 domain-containing protein [Aliiglaciecola sp. LCG003]